MSTLGGVQELVASFEALARWEIHIKENWRIDPGAALPMAGMISGPVGAHLKRWSVQQIQAIKEYHRHQRLEREIETTWKAYVDTMGAQLRAGVAVDLERLSPADLDELRAAARQLQGYAAAHPPVPVPTTTLDPNAVVHRGFDAIADLARTDPDFTYLDDVVHDRGSRHRQRNTGVRVIGAPFLLIQSSERFTATRVVSYSGLRMRVSGRMPRNPRTELAAIAKRRGQVPLLSVDVSGVSPVEPASGIQQLMPSKTPIAAHEPIPLTPWRAPRPPRVLQS